MLGKLLFTFTKFYCGVTPINLEKIQNTKQKVFFANHSSHLDTISLLTSLPNDIRKHTRPVAAADYWGKNFITRFVSRKILNCVLINRNNSNTETIKKDPLDPVYEALNNGDSLLIFPEGTRNNTDTLLPFKSGIYHLQNKYPHVDFIPVYIKNANRSMPKGCNHPLPLICSIYFGNALEKIDNEAKNDFLNRAKNSIIELGEIK